ncbi:hypothetical protein AB0I28_00070 [Phytomonospora sp. NPDC050363]|uniref:hypothetical protein n=1 Tax=Phytomonospora sp. NPDC050363 TaxID=3155642 RepID=UPI0033D93454
MAQLNVMYWNLGGLDQQRASLAGTSYPSLVASAIRAGDITVAGFSGVRSGLANALGEAVVAELRGYYPHSTWIHSASPPLGQGRDEQYLIIWDGSRAGAYKPPGYEYWLWQYPAPNPLDGLLGFPRPESMSPDLPPFTMFFKLGSSGKWMPMSVLHAPTWPDAWQNGAEITRAMANLTRVEAFDVGDGALLMGSFNVPADDDVGTPGSNGALAFGRLAGPNGKYDQAMHGHRTALGPPIVATTDSQSYVQTSDNFFVRRNSSQRGITVSAPGILGVISGSLGRLDAQGTWQPAPFRPALANVEARSVGDDKVTAGADGSYDRFDDAFAAYRLYVSDHAPIAITINY